MPTCEHCGSTDIGVDRQGTFPEIERWAWCEACGEDAGHLTDEQIDHIYFESPFEHL
jgi:hypothetical protein